MQDKAYEQSLVFAAKNGNEKSFEQLYNMYYGKVYALALSTLKSSDDAEDVLQQTFIKAWQSIGSIDNTAAFNTWIQRITVNQCYSLLRGRHVEVSLDADEEDGESVEPESDLMLPEVYAEREDLSERLSVIINSLSAVQRQTITLFYFDGLTVTEIAQVMDCKEETVKSRLFLARKAIKTEIEEQESKTGQRFYGVAGFPLIAFARLFNAHISATVISSGTAATLFSGVVGHTAVTAAGSAAIGAAKTAGAAGAKVTGSLAAKTAGTAVVKTAVKGVAVKVIAAIAAVGVTVGGAVTGVKLINDKKDDGTSVVEQADVQQQTPAPVVESRKEIRDADLGANEQSLRELLGWVNFYFSEYDSSSNTDINGNEAWLLQGIGAYNTEEIEVSKACPYEPSRPMDYDEEEAFIERQRMRADWVLVEDGRAVEWIAENVLNIDSEALRQYVLAAESANSLYRDREDVYYVGCGGVGGPSLCADFVWVKTDGKRYYVKYDVYYPAITPKDGYEQFFENKMQTESYYAEVELKDEKGVKYWSIYKNSQSVPEDMFTADAPDLFSGKSGTYTVEGFFATSGKGSLTVKKDGSFTAYETETFRHYDSESYDDDTKDIAESRYSGKFSDIKRLDRYTYRAKLGKFDYQNKPGTSKEEGNVTYNYNEARCLAEGKTVYIYQKGTPVAKMPEGTIELLGSSSNVSGGVIKRPCICCDTGDKYAPVACFFLNG